MQVVNASDSSQVSLATRNRLYAALNRALAKEDTVPQAALEQWRSASKNAKSKFSFLQMWVADTSWGKFTVFESECTSKEDAKP